MTIAACYVSPEGVVLGADSTSSSSIPSGPGAGGYHYLNHNQKLFELGENSTVGLVTWGLAGLANVSYRTLVANLAEDLKANPPASFDQVADRWNQQFWTAYNSDPLLQLYRMLETKPAHDPNNGASRSEEEEKQLERLREVLVVGFCIGGYWAPHREPSARAMIFEPRQTGPASPIQLGFHKYGFWGAPNMIKRLMWGVDENLKQAILTSNKWHGTEAELDLLLSQYQLGHPILPIRDAVDFVHSCIYSTIKALKFSNFSQVCGGPIEIGVITTDRNFRWVKHKPWNAALMEGAT